MLRLAISLLLFSVFTQAQSLGSIEARDKRTIDLGFVIRSFLQQSADLSNAKIQAKVPVRPTATTTTTMTSTAGPTTTTMPAPTTNQRPRPPIVFIKPFPFAGKFAFGYDTVGNFMQQQQPLIFANSVPNNGFINFAYDVADESTDPTTTTPTTTATTTTTTAPIATTQAPMPAAMPQRPEERQQQQQRATPMQPNNATPTNALQPQRNVKIIYQYVPVPQFKTPATPAVQNYFASAPLNYDYDFYSNDNFNGPQHGGQLAIYENPRQIHKTQHEQQPQYQLAQLPANVDGDFFNLHSPFPAQQRAKVNSAQINNQSTPPQLNENLVYQYAQPDDFYTSNEPVANNDAQSSIDDGAANTAADDTSNESDNNVTSPKDDAADAEPNTDDYPADSYAYDPSSINETPSSTLAPDYVKIRFVPVSSTPQSTINSGHYVDDTDISSHLNNYKYVFSNRADAQSSKPQPAEFYNPKNAVTHYEDTKPAHQPTSSAYSSSRSHSSFVNYHAPSASSSYSYTNGHPYPQHH